MNLTQILTKQGIISKKQALYAQKESLDKKEPLSETLLRLSIANSSQILDALSEQFSLPIIDLGKVDPTKDLLNLLPSKIVFKFECVPVSINNSRLQIATHNPTNLSKFDELELLIDKRIELVLVDEQDLKNFIRNHYGLAEDTLEALEDQGKGQDTNINPEDAIDISEEASVVKLVNDLLIEAFNERATDIHIEPYKDYLEIRYRIDGILILAKVSDRMHRFRFAIVNRLKIMANLNISEKRRPQDGRIAIKHKSTEYDLRVSVIPMLFGEGIVLRVLDKSNALHQLEDLGMNKKIYNNWEQIINSKNGIILVTGPTGSGKSTTLYSSLNKILTSNVKAITVEDPVEYHINGVNQIQVHNDVGLTFAQGLRSILRHDPDIIMIGEIRDLETAEAAIQASLTGHLVFSTLHTNDACSSITRLVDMKIEPYLVASSLKAVLAQRLIRTICKKCAKFSSENNLSFSKDLDLNGIKTRFGAGCKECKHSGYLGRIGVYELLSIDNELRRSIISSSDPISLATSARERKLLSTLLEDGIEKIKEGITTPNEVIRAIET